MYHGKGNGASGYNNGMTEFASEEKTPVWNLDAGQWQRLAQKAQGSADALEDGAYVRAENGPEGGTPELQFFATALNKPSGFAYPFLEPIRGSRFLGASIGRAWHEAATGFVVFEVFVSAAAQALAADYESGVSDLDFVTYEQAVETAVRGTVAEAIWLYGEFKRLVSIAS